MTRVVEINDIEELGDLRLLWKSLLGGTRRATFFHTLDWLETYWRHYGAGQRLRVLVVSSGQETLGILPLVVRTERTRLGPVRVLTYPLHDWGSFYSPIGPNPTATLVAGLNHVYETRRDWDLLDLRWIDRDRTDLGRTKSALETAGFAFREGVWNQVATLDLTIPWAEYWGGRSNDLRHKIRRRERKLAQRGPVTYIRYRPLGAGQGEDDPRWDLYDACLAVAERSWQGSSTNGTTISHPSVRQFLRDAHAAAVHLGAADLNLLLVDGRPAAFDYCYHFQGYVSGLRKGFDPEFADDGVGTILLARQLEDNFRRGDHTYDIGPGSMEYKRAWYTAVESSYRYTHYPRTVARAQVLRLKHAVNRWRRGADHPHVVEQLA